MKSLTQVLTVASLLVVLLAVASAFVPLDDDELAAVAQELYMENPELAQLFPEYRAEKRARMTGFNAIDTLKMMRNRENLLKKLKASQGRRRRVAEQE